MVRVVNDIGVGHDHRVAGKEVRDLKERTDDIGLRPSLIAAYSESAVEQLAPIAANYGYVLDSSGNHCVQLPLEQCLPGKSRHALGL